MKELTKNAITVLERRYLLKDAEGKVIETPDQMFWRVAQAVAEADRSKNSNALDWAGKYYDMMSNLDFLPNSPTLMNAGRELGQLSACFVLPVGDSMEEIFDAIKNTALIHKSGGGTGFSFSRLRPSNDRVNSTSGVSSGPVSFMRVFNSATDVIKQGGTRRGANMGILRVDHPDIKEFIRCKENPAEFNNFNISVAITDEFMGALADDDVYALVNPHTGEVVGTESAAEIFEMIVDRAWKNGEPGIVFIDRMNEDNPLPGTVIESTNPCGEQPLLPYESCNLGSINLGNFVDEKEAGGVDYHRLRHVVKLAVRFLDDVIDVNRYPLPEIEEVTKKSRKIGLGVMGWADLLVKLRIPYNSDRAFKLAGDVMEFISLQAWEASEDLARERGAYPGYCADTAKAPLSRNATVTTIAPTGSISIIANASSGVEPLFAIAYTKTVMDEDKLVEVHPEFLRVMGETMSWLKITERLKGKTSIQDMEDIPEDIRRVFLTAHDISPMEHVRMQAAFQKFTDNAVSKTVNFPNEATKKDVEAAFLYAWDMGCKGVTVYRDGSRDNQVLSVASEAKPVAEEKTPIDKGDRPSMLLGRTFKQQTGCGSIYVTINETPEGKPFELFATIGKAGGCADSQSQAIGRMVSMAWRSGITAEEVLRQLSDISCHSHHGMGDKRVQSCADAVSKAIREYIGVKTHNSAPVLEKKKVRVNGACKECGGQIEHEGGCVVCHSCGFSECA